MERLQLPYIPRYRDGERFFNYKPEHNLFTVYHCIKLFPGYWERMVDKTSLNTPMYSFRIKSLNAPASDKADGKS